jgi:hypothetical protein
MTTISGYGMGDPTETETSRKRSNHCLEEMTFSSFFIILLSYSFHVGQNTVRAVITKKRPVFGKAGENRPPPTL